MHITRRETLKAERAELLAELPSHTLRHDPRVHRLQEINAELETQTYLQRVQACPHCSTETAPDDCV
jgi:hypothetical protein